MEDSGKAILGLRITLTPRLRILAHIVICFVSGYRLPRFVEEGWLKEITGRKRARIYAFEKYIKAFKE